MRKLMKIGFLFLFILMACGEGNIPTAVEPSIEVHAAYITSRPIVDGILNEPDWEKAMPYQVHIGQTDIKTGQSIGGYNVEMKSLWWRDWGYSSQWGRQAYVALSLSWPDDDKNIDKNSWQYNPNDTSWTRSRNGSDWLLISWLSATQYTDLWYWDAALTNPLGYAEDQYIETFQINDSTDVNQFNIDGLRFLNDIQDENNAWDNNYNDNRTPRDSTDDFPMKIWRTNPAQVMPVKPRVLSDDRERLSFLLQSDADFMINAFTAPYAKLTQSISVPGYVLEDPQNKSADIMAAGRHENGYWTVELVRRCKTSDDNIDISFDPDDRYSSYYFSLLMGDNSHAPLTRTLSRSAQRQILQSENYVRFNFEFIVSRTTP